MEADIKSRKIRSSDIGTASKMSSDEKKISFLNKYFVFKKVRDVNAEKVSRIMIDSSPIEIREEKVEQAHINQDLKLPRKPRVNKLKGKVKLGTQLEDVEAQKTVHDVKSVVPATTIAPGRRIIVKKPKGKVRVRRKKVKIRIKKPDE